MTGWGPASSTTWIAVTGIMLACLMGTTSSASCQDLRTCSACNEMVCASIISKCMLIQACKCDLTKSPDNNCTCCADCAKCLGYLYTECCSCLGMCEPRAQVMDKTDSQVGDIPEPFQALFQALTGDKDILLRWTSMTFPIDMELTDIDRTTNTKNMYRLGVVSTNQNSDSTPALSQQVLTVNCTVLYWSQCMSGNKCKETCRSTGATAYRWFFDGCCECVGSTCVNYGVNESRCIKCPLVEEEEEFDDELTDQYLIGDEEPFNDFEAQQLGVEGEDKQQAAKTDDGDL